MLTDKQCKTAVCPPDRKRVRVTDSGASAWRSASENSVRTALISLGYTSELQTWHGFRATARTMLAERLDVDPLLIEAQLAHAVKDANGRAYNRSKYLEQRVKMMQMWADFLDQTGSIDLLQRSSAARIPTPRNLAAAKRIAAASRPSGFGLR